MATTREHLISLHEFLCKQARDLSVRKNHDYSGGEDARDAFLNFRKCEELGLCQAETGILVRLSDKIARLNTIAGKDTDYLVNDEKLLDTVLDMINYTILFYALHQERKMRNKVLDEIAKLGEEMQ